MKHSEKNPNLLRAYAAVDLSRLKENFDAIQSALSREKKVLAVVKAGAYGHDAAAVAHALSGRAAYFGVATAPEGVHLREEGITEPILVFGRTPLKEAALLSDYNLTQCVFSFDYANELGLALNQQNRKAKIHIKIDTGMGRLGFLHSDERLVEQILSISRICAFEIEGIFSHFAKSDAPGDPFTSLQAQRFEDAVNKLEAAGLSFSYKHIANSAATLLGIPDSCNMVRAGICLYGDFPSEEVRDIWNKAHPNSPILPVMRLCASIAQIRTLKKGEPLGYDCSWIAPRDTKIAVVAAGYADGVPRAISSRARAIDENCSIVGNVCMDMTFVDITDSPRDISEGDIVPLFGEGGVSATDWANTAGTIPYEIYCGISARIPRVTFEEGQVTKIIG